MVRANLTGLLCPGSGGGQSNLMKCLNAQMSELDKFSTRSQSDLDLHTGQHTLHNAQDQARDAKNHHGPKGPPPVLAASVPPDIADPGRLTLLHVSLQPQETVAKEGEVTLRMVDGFFVRPCLGIE